MGKIKTKFLGHLRNLSNLSHLGSKTDKKTGQSAQNEEFLKMAKEQLLKLSDRGLAIPVFTL